MNDLGLTMAWCAIQVSFVLIPATVLFAFASRRSPATGAWVASLSLGLVVAVSLLTLMAPGGESRGPSAPASPIPSKTVAIGGRSEAPPSTPRPGESGGAGWSLAVLRAVWERLETTTAVPAARCRPWGGPLAAVALAGMGVGLLHLIVGLWGVHLCVRRSRPVDDPELVELVRLLRGELGCRRRVEARETPELTSPATAGWRRVVVLLPEDWRTWDGHERRAVLAHELAHVCRGDYATGVVGRLALALHFYHPLVIWLVGRLQCEQELAADALGARFAGGRTRYLLSLSRLALRQDGRSPCWPARTFLPAKGILIRRIAMLRDESLSENRPWSAPRRTVAALLLLAVACGVLILQGPARGDDAAKVDGEVKAATRESRPDDKEQGEPFDLTYLPDDIQGFMAFRPAATFRRAGMGTYRTMLNLLIAREWSKAANTFGFDPAKPGQEPPRVEMFEQVLGLVSVKQVRHERPRWGVMLGDVISARTTEPVDWIGLARAFKLEPTEAREGTRVYYRVKAPMLGPGGCIFCPDDRTLVFASEKRLLQLLRRHTPTAPAFASTKGWDRSLRGLLVLAFDSRDDLLRRMVLDSDDAQDYLDVIGKFRHGGLLTFRVDNSDEIVLDGVATLPDASAGESTVRASQAFLEVLRKQVSRPDPGAPPSKDHELARRMFVDLVTNCRVEGDSQSVILRVSGLGTIAEFASLVAAGVL